jgi:DNA processing protein
VISTETAALVALLRHPGARPPSVYADLVEEHRSALAILEQEQEGGVNSARPRLFSDEETMEELLEKATADLARWNERGFHPVTVLDREYPDNLRSVHDRPPLIFLAGALNPPRDARSVAVVGTRRPSPNGLAEATRIARHLVACGYTVASGLAAGVDTAAHTAALAAGGRTLAVIGTGLAHSYPPQNAALQRRIATEHAVISQFWPDTPPSRRTFPLRNATLSGLTLATVVVEATEHSGTHTHVRLALNHGRPVFLTSSVPQDQPWAQQLSTKPGVHVVASPHDVTATLTRFTEPSPLVP